MLKFVVFYDAICHVGGHKNISEASAAFIFKEEISTKYYRPMFFPKIWCPYRRLHVFAAQKTTAYSSRSSLDLILTLLAITHTLHEIYP
jgi:hypothetical protein